MHYGFSPVYNPFPSREKPFSKVLCLTINSVFISCIISQDPKGYYPQSNVLTCLSFRRHYRNQV